MASLGIPSWGSPFAAIWAVGASPEQAPAKYSGGKPPHSTWAVPAATSCSWFMREDAAPGTEALRPYELIAGGAAEAVRVRAANRRSAISMPPRQQAQTPDQPSRRPAHAPKNEPAAPPAK